MNQTDMHYSWRQRLSLSLVWLLALSVAIRLPLLLAPGYTPDVSLHKLWGLALVQNGWSALAALPNSPVNYFPNYALPLYLFKGLSAVALNFWPSAAPNRPLFTAIMKLPGLLGDLAIGVIIFFWARRVATPRTALTAAGLYLFAPGVIYDTALWGQLESLWTALALAALFAWDAGRRNAAGVLFVAAVATKLHAVIFLPLLLLGYWREGFKKFCRAHLPAIAAAVTAVVLPYALVLGPARLFLGSLGSVGKYPFLTMNAMNIWWPFSRIAGGLLRDDQWPLPAIYIGFALFVGAALLVIHSLSRDAQTERLLQAGALLALAFFLFPTEIHERYLFPFFAWAAIPAAASRAWRIGYGVLAVSFLSNLIFAAPFVIAPRTRSLAELMPFFDSLFLINLLVFFCLLRNFLRAASRKTAPAVL